MYYLSWANATKPKGISIVGALTGLDPAASRFDDETLNVYEVGAKTDWLDERLVLEHTSLFYQEFDDELVYSSQKQDPDTGLLSLPRRSMHPRLPYMALNWTLPGRQRMRCGWNGSYTYLNTEYDDFTLSTKGPGTIADAGNCTIVAESGQGQQRCR